MTTIENRPIMINGSPPPDWSPPAYTARPVQFSVARDSSGVNGPSPLPDPPDSVDSSIIRNLNVLDSESGYGSAGTTAATFSTFRPKQHIYESPTFT